MADKEKNASGKKGGSSNKDDSSSSAQENVWTQYADVIASIIGEDASKGPAALMDSLQERVKLTFPDADKDPVDFPKDFAAPDLDRIQPYPERVFDRTRELAMATSTQAFSNTEGTAAQALDAATATWDVARKQAEASAEVAYNTLDTAATAALKKYNAICPSQSVVDYHTLLQETTAAISAYEAAISGVMTTVGQAFSAWLTAKLTYDAAIKTAESVRLQADTTADTAYWTSVTQALEPVAA